MAWPRLEPNLSAMQGDEVQKRVAEVAKAFYQRADDLAVLLARASTRRSWWSPLIFRRSAPRRCRRSRAL
jgi:hypothetical protein